MGSSDWSGTESDSGDIARDLVRERGYHHAQLKVRNNVGHVQFHNRNLDGDERNRNYGISADFEFADEEIERLQEAEPTVTSLATNKHQYVPVLVEENEDGNFVVHVPAIQRSIVADGLSA